MIFFGDLEILIRVKKSDAGGTNGKLEIDFQAPKVNFSGNNINLSGKTQGKLREFWSFEMLGPVTACIS